MKKFVAILLSLVTLFCFTACSGDADAHVYQQLCEAKNSQNFPFEETSGDNSKALKIAGEYDLFKGVVNVYEKQIWASFLRSTHISNQNGANPVSEQFVGEVYIDMYTENHVVKAQVSSYSLQMDLNPKEEWTDGIVMSGGSNGCCVIYSFDLNKYLENGKFEVADATQTMEWQVDNTASKDMKGGTGIPYTERELNWDDAALDFIVAGVNRAMAEIDKVVADAGITAAE